MVGCGAAWVSQLPPGFEGPDHRSRRWTITLTSQWLSATQVDFSHLLLHVFLILEAKGAAPIGICSSGGLRDKGQTSRWFLSLLLRQGTQHIALARPTVGQGKSQTALMFWGGGACFPHRRYQQQRLGHTQECVSSLERQGTQR